METLTLWGMRVKREQEGLHYVEWRHGELTLRGSGSASYMLSLILMREDVAWVRMTLYVDATTPADALRQIESLIQLPEELRP